MLRKKLKIYKNVTGGLQMAEIVFHRKTKTFHLSNQQISYVMCVLSNGHIGQLYYGKRIHDREDFSHLLETCERPMTSYVYEGDRTFSLEHIRQEYPVYGSTDYRNPAVEIRQENGSRIMDFRYDGYEITGGKPHLEGLPATYTEAEEEAKTLKIFLVDSVTNIQMELWYSIFDEGGVIARSTRFYNRGKKAVHVLNAMSLSLDLPEKDYVWMQLSGSWGRERHIKERVLEQGIQSIESMRGHSSHEHNPFLVLRRPWTTEQSGEAIGIGLIYSGNFQIQAEVDTHDVTRITAGINPRGFDWKLNPEEAFQTPEAVLVYSEKGLGGMSRIFHRLYGRRLARGVWRDRPRPILINNWEATYFDFTEEKLEKIAEKAKACGVEAFVLDDGWFGKRRNDRAGLGDWYANRELLPDGIEGLSKRIEAMGLMFGLWIEPEMVNKDSDLYRAHPDWILQVPERPVSHGRYQYVLDFSRKEVVDYIHGMLQRLLSSAHISYIKWDMNRSITECYSQALPPEQQGEVFHRYILGVYDLYERLIHEFPEILFESCASGGGRFDPGMLYYAPQCWTSDDSDAIERLKIQYGTSLCYPLSSMGSHVSIVPNHQVFRMTPLHTRANVAFFGTFGYELDLDKLSGGELNEVKDQISFMKKYREILQFGDFYRLKSPFQGNEAAWMAVSPDKNTALVGWYRVLNGVNMPYSRIRLQGLNPDALYENVRNGTENYGDELMNYGLITTDVTAGQVPDGAEPCTDFDSRIYLLQVKK